MEKRTYAKNSRIASTSRTGDDSAKKEAVGMMKAFAPSGTYQASVGDSEALKQEATLSALAPSAKAPAPFHD